MQVSCLVQPPILVLNKLEVLAKLGLSCGRSRPAGLAVVDHRSLRIITFFVKPARRRNTGEMQFGLRLTFLHFVP